MALRLLPVLLVVLLITAGLALRDAGRAADVSAPERHSDRRSACGPDAGTPARELSLARARELIRCLHNEQRARHGLAGLAYERRLEVAAQRHVEDMVRRHFFAHDTPEGLAPEDRALMAGYPTKQYSSGENLAWGTGTEASPVEIVDGWMQSPGHRENIPPQRLHAHRRRGEAGRAGRHREPTARRDLRHQLRRAADLIAFLSAPQRLGGR